MPDIDYEGPKRRQHDLVTDLLTDRIDAVGRIASAANIDTMSRLDNHIEHCAAQQRWILRSMIGLCTWVVMHSPEVLGLGAKVLAGVTK